MSGAPNQRRMTQAEMAFTSVEAGKRAERRAAILERRLATVEERLAEQDRATSELARALQDASDMASALHVVVKELQQAAGEGGSEALSDLDQRVNTLESTQPRYQRFFDLLMDDMPTVGEIKEGVIDIQKAVIAINERLTALESQPKPRRGRPKGSKNKPKPQTVVVEPVTEKDENTVLAGDSSNSEASDT